MAYNEILLQENPYRRRRRRSRSKRNPAAVLAMPKGLEDFFQGISPMDAGLALGGFAGSIMLPGVIIKDAVTRGQKFGKVLLALGSAGLVGLAAKSVGGSSGARAAVAGGMAAALSQALTAFTDIEIGRPGPRMLGRGHPGARPGVGSYPAQPKNIVDQWPRAV